jgi:hypothetical protein
LTRSTAKEASGGWEGCRNEGAIRTSLPIRPAYLIAFPSRTIGCREGILLHEDAIVSGVTTHPNEPRQFPFHFLNK